MASTDRIKTLVHEVRRRWRRRAILQGLAVSLFVLLAGALLLLLLYTELNVSPVFITAGAVLCVLLFLGLFVYLVLRPAFHRISDRQVALFIEERLPELEDRLNSAIEIDDRVLSREHSLLIDRLIEDAVQRSVVVPPATLIDEKRGRFLAAGAALSLVLFLIFGYSSLDSFRGPAGGLSLSSIVPVPRPLISVTPGNAEIEKGASQDVVVELREESDDEVELHFKLGDGAWQKSSMNKALNEPAFLYAFSDVQEPIEYFAKAGENRSDTYTISLYEFPDVAQIDLTYSYPRYTGREPRLEQDALGDIEGLKGSTVSLAVQTTGTTERAEMVLEDGRTVALKDAGEGRFEGRYALETDGSYFIRLSDREGKQNKFPEEYRILAVDDEKPYITLTDPKQDVRVNAIQEVLVAVTVEDDFGVKDARLKYSVNGSDEQSIPLAEASTTTETEINGEHLFFLEEYDLQPGDVISYYIEASDHFDREAPEMTDMYFIEVIPFDLEFSQVNNAGAGMPGQPSGVVLSQQQIISATWKLHRERRDREESAFQADVEALAQAQANLQQNIEGRINSTAFAVELQASEDSRKIVAFLRDAVKEMKLAVVELQGARLEEALTPERRALNHLLRADALNKERQIAISRQPGAAGAGGSTEERMTELMDLELDISKDKYETQEQSQPPGQQQDQQVEEALQRIRELARKQQNLAQQAQNNEITGEDRKRTVDRLKRDQDELREQAEELSSNLRQMARSGDQVSREANERMERAADHMEGAEQALQRGDTQQAMSRQQQAVNELQRLEEELNRARTGNARGTLDDLAEQFDRLQEQERRLEQNLQDANREAQRNGGRMSPETAERLRQERRQALDELQQLQRQAENLRERSAANDPELAAAARELVQQIRREDLERSMEESEAALQRGWLDQANRIEEDIQAGLEGVESSMRQLESRLPVTEEEQLARSLEDVRDLMRRIERMEESANQPGGQPGGQQQGESRNQEGQEGEGQQADNAGQGQGRGGDAAARNERMRREMARARETLDRLRNDIGGDPEARAALGRIRNNWARADHTGQRVEGDAADNLFDNEVYESLSQLEAALVRQLDGIALEKKLFGSRKGDVPAEYRELVDKYYETLAKSRNR